MSRRCMRDVLELGTPPSKPERVCDDDDARLTATPAHRRTSAFKLFQALSSLAKAVYNVRNWFLSLAAVNQAFNQRIQPGFS